ncbi:MAG TPA: hypothetical protein VFD59_06620 [Nocardioidaceae bacterium]|nr:hypothetical protein [Nocardioidaceae bacterium]
MNAASNAEMNRSVARVVPDVQASRWISRQLHWERVLDALRAEQHADSERRAA